ncbi:MAG: enoyl-CoA hydratase/isomerase family protein [Actinomycetota bacterium]
MSDVVLRELVDRVAVLSLNRPEKHNAFNDEMIEAWSVAVDWAIAEPDARSILIRGEGASFSSGRDVTELGRRAKGETDYEFVRRAQDDAIKLGEAPKPVIAALKGYVFGGSFELALRADIRVAATGATMCFPEIGFGILPDTGGTQLLTLVAGPSRAKLLIMTGDRIGAEDAKAWGIVDVVVPPEALDATAMDLARSIAAGPPLALAMAKQLVDQLAGDAVARGTRAELVAQTALFASEDYREARTAREEKRPPRFTGR